MESVWNFFAIITSWGDMQLFTPKKNLMLASCVMKVWILGSVDQKVWKGTWKMFITMVTFSLFFKAPSLISGRPGTPWARTFSMRSLFQKLSWHLQAQKAFCCSYQRKTLCLPIMWQRVYTTWEFEGTHDKAASTVISRFFY